MPTSTDAESGQVLQKGVASYEYTFPNPTSTDSGQVNITNGHWQFNDLCPYGDYYDIRFSQCFAPTPAGCPDNTSKRKRELSVHVSSPDKHGMDLLSRFWRVEVIYAVRV